MSSTWEDRSSSPANAAEAHRGKHLLLAIWALALFTAFLFGSTIVNLVFTKQAYEGARGQIEAMRTLNESMMEVRKSLAELVTSIKEAQEPERDADDDSMFHRSRLGDEKI